MRRNVFRVTGWLCGIAIAAGLVFSPLNAEAGMYTRQAGNFPGTQWKSVETEHFIIHYYPEVEYTARMVAKHCDRVYEKVCSQFDYYLTRKTHIVVRDHEEMANGFAVFNADWVTIWATNLYYRLRGRMDWVPVVLTHEFAHIVSLKVNESFAEHAMLGASYGIHRDGTNNYSVGFMLPVAGGMKAPFFWIEGGAEYWTDQAGPNEWTTSRDMLMRMSVLEDEVLTWNEWQTRGGKNRFDQERIYNHGYNFARYLKERFGDQAYAQLAIEGGKAWRFNWNKVFVDVFGVSGEKLYDDWRVWLKAHYEEQVADVRAEPAIGFKVLLSKPDKPWEEMSQEEREAEGIMLDDTLEQYYPRFSPDGEHLLFWQNGGSVVMLPVTEEMLPQYSGKYLDRSEHWKIEDGAASIDHVTDTPFDLSPDGNRIVFASAYRDYKLMEPSRALGGCPWLNTGSIKGFSPDGYNWNDLYIADIVRGADGGIADIVGDGAMLLPYEKINRFTKDQRAISPAWSPDGERIAFIAYGDGRHRIGVKGLGASDDGIRWLATFADNTQAGGLAWSPDGRSLAFQLYKDGQADIAVVGGDGTGLRMITLDAAEDRDPEWAPDGSTLYYSSDRTGIFNIYALDLESGDLRQVTNVAGGASHPHVTDRGNLLYTNFTAYGFKIFYLKKGDFLGRSVAWGAPEASSSDAHIAYGDILPHLDPRNYFFLKNLQPISLTPILVFDYEHVRGGAQVLWMDYLEKHTFIGQAAFGEDYDLIAQYLNEQWYLDFMVGAIQVQRSIDVGARVPLISIYPEIVTEVELKQKVRQTEFMAGAAYEFSDEFGTAVTASIRSIEGKTSLSGSGWDSQIDNQFYALSMMYSSLNPNRGDNDINPRGGWQSSLNYTFGRTWVAEAYRTDDGETLDRYNYHRLDFSFTKFLPLPCWPLSLSHARLLRWIDRHNHTLELSFHGGYIDRNVHVYDEFHAGGRIPLITTADYSSNVQFAGYEAFSIFGETLLVASLAYRFPLPGFGLNGDIDRGFGPLFVDKIYLSVFGTAGNAWSYNRKNERERPFIDTASNGNKMLYDAGLEIRVKSFLFNSLYWNNFVRVAYGFQDVYGTSAGPVFSDVNGDMILEDMYPLLDHVDEIEESGLRFYVGIGTGW